MILLRKKAQALSMNTIIIAALGLAVLVILFMVFTGRMNLFGEGLNKAQANTIGDCRALCVSTGYSDGQEASDSGNCPRGTDTRTVTKTCCCTRGTD